MKNLYSIKVRGYQLDNIFDMDRYEYNVIVNEDIIEISCDTDISIEGCNVSIDLKDKDSYIHKISVFDGQKINTYSVNIQKELTKEPSKEKTDISWTHWLVRRIFCKLFSTCTVITAASLF